jgi:hypothetical protein
MANRFARRVVSEGKESNVPQWASDLALAESSIILDQMRRYVKQISFGIVSG